MNPEEAAENWQAARRLLQRARALLPANPVYEDAQGKQLGTLHQYEEFLTHSELELALGKLESLGELNDVPRAYWRHLQDAALRLDLADRAAYYAMKSEPR